MEGARPGDYLTFVAFVSVKRTIRIRSRSRRARPHGEVLAFKVRVGELSGPQVDGHHGFQDSGEHADRDMSPHAVSV